MSIQVARKGWIAVGPEVTPGVPVAQASNVYFVTETLEGMAKPIQNTAAYGIRDQVFTAVQGEKWGAGDVELNLDPNIAGYFISATLGTVNTTTVSGSTKSHSMTQNQSSVPKTLSLYLNRVVDEQLFPYSAVNQLDVSFSVDKLANMKAGIISQFPSDNVSGSVTAVAETLYTWGSASLQFGANNTAATNAAATPVTDFSLTINNNTQAIFESGQYTATRIAHKDFDAKGTWTEYFESTADRNAYYNTTFQAMIAKFLGSGSGATQEKMQFNIFNMYIDPFSVETAVDNFFIEKASFVAAYSIGDGATMAATLVNTTSSY